MASGGARTGTPGATYANRTDLNAGTQPVQAASGQAYGQRGAQEAAQRAVPLAETLYNVDAASHAAQTGAFHRPTERPQEPITAGMQQGAGPGPEVLTAAVGGDSQAALTQLRTLYRIAPYEDLRALIERVERAGS